MFPEDGGSAGSSGYVNSLGKDINALFSDINNIQHGTPQYWYDPKSKQMVVEYPNGTGNVPVAPHQSGNEQG